MASSGRRGVASDVILDKNVEVALNSTCSDLKKNCLRDHRVAKCGQFIPLTSNQVGRLGHKKSLASDFEVSQ